MKFTFLQKQMDISEIEEVEDSDKHVFIYIIRVLIVKSLKQSMCRPTTNDAF